MTLDGASGVVLEDYDNSCAGIRRTCHEVMQDSTHVKINDIAVSSLAAKLDAEHAQDIYSLKGFDQEMHFFDSARPELTACYLLALDALNFCFWPDPTLEYEHLARGLKRSALECPERLLPEALSRASECDLGLLLNWDKPVPLAAERTRLLREVGAGIAVHYGGKVTNLIHAAGGSAVKLCSLVTAVFPGFRDAAIYRGRQTFLYKRAQIFIADLYGAFQGQGLGAFHDIDQLTMFADYRVPVVLRQHGCLEYAPALAATIDEGREVAAGSEEEIEIRAATVEAVERLKHAIGALQGGPPPPAVHLDWILWDMGERKRDEQRNHHKTMTIFY